MFDDLLDILGLNKSTSRTGSYAQSSLNNSTLSDLFTIVNGIKDLQNEISRLRDENDHLKFKNSALSQELLFIKNGK